MEKAVSAMQNMMFGRRQELAQARDDLERKASYARYAQEKVSDLEQEIRELEQLLAMAKEVAAVPVQQPPVVQPEAPCADATVTGVTELG